MSQKKQHEYFPVADHRREGPRKGNSRGSDRIYFVEFFRVFLILSVFLCHIGDWIDVELKEDIMSFFGTKKWFLGFAVHPFFIIGGFFLYSRLPKMAVNGTSECAHAEILPPSPVQSSVFSSIGKLWMRLMPGVIFCYTVLLISGARNWRQLPFCFFPSEYYGLSRELVGYSDWFVGVYFVTSCLFTALFAAYRDRSAWIVICVLTLICWCVQTTIQSNSMLLCNGLYYGFLTPELARGICCMGLGMMAGYLSEHWAPRVSLFLRLVATVVEGLALFMIFNFMYRTSLAYYNGFAVYIVTAALLISAAHSWGYISGLLNRFGGVMYVSRYTYSLFLIQGMLIYFFNYKRHFGLDAHCCSLIILIAAVPLTLIEYHFVEKWLAAKLKLLLRNSSDGGGGYV